MIQYGGHNETDKNGDLVCRFCRMSHYMVDHFECRAGDNPGTVVADITECVYGEMCHESERYDRDQADAV